MINWKIPRKSAHFSCQFTPWLLIFSIVLSVFAARAMGQDLVILDFPGKFDGKSLPAGLAAWPIESNLGANSIEIPLIPLNNEASLLVTVMFVDAPKQNLQAEWITSDSKTTILANNLSESVQGWNQRTFRVSPELLQQEGSLVLSSDAETQPVKRVTLAWTVPQSVFVGLEGQQVRYVPSASEIFTTADFSQETSAPLPDALVHGIWKVSLQEAVEPLDTSVQFVIPIDSVPQAAVFRAKLLNIPFDQSAVLSINGQQVGPLSLTVPGLGSSGYYRSSDGSLAFAGWREAAVVMPASYFKIGDNSITVKGTKGAHIKEARLELSFDEEGSPLDPSTVTTGTTSLTSGVILP